MWLSEALLNDGPRGKRLEKRGLQEEGTIEPVEGIPQLPGVKMDEPENISACAALSGYVRIGLDLMKRFLAVASAEQRKGLGQCKLEQRFAAEFVAVWGMVLLFARKNVHLCVPITIGVNHCGQLPSVKTRKARGDDYARALQKLGPD